jgi:glycosyltransferase involved in cell wall biosynthesis
MNWKYFNPKFEYEEKFQDAGWPWFGHKLFAYDFIRNIQPKTIVELGTHRGTSFWSFCQAVKDAKINSSLYAIDTWKGEKHAGFYGEDVFDEVKEIKHKYYGDLKIKLIRKTFDEALADFQDKSINLLHVDGLHTYEAVKHDFENWSPKVRDDGVIIFHDVFVSHNDFGVYKLWDELKKKYKTIEFHHSFGLGVLFKDRKDYEFFLNDEKEMQMSYSFSSEERKNIEINRSFYAIQQKQYELDRKADSCKLEIKDAILTLRNEMIEKNASIQQKDAEINFMKSSKFWKLREVNFKIKFVVFHPVKFSNKYYQKSKILYRESTQSFKHEGLSRMFLRIYNYIFYGKGVLNKKDIVNRKKYSLDVIGHGAMGKNKYLYSPIKTVYYVSNIPEGGAGKYIDDLIDAFETAHLNFVQLKKKEDLDVHKKSFKKGDILLFQYLYNSDLTFKDIVDAKNKYGLKLVIPVHDFYFLQKNHSDFYQCHIGIYSSFNDNSPLNPTVLDLLKAADLIIYPSRFVKNVFDKVFVFEHAKLSRHIDYKIHDFLDIPKVDRTINMGIINNITIVKGADYYPKLFSIDKYKGHHIQYHVFGMNEVKSSNVIFHGPYIEDEIFSLLKKNNIHGLVFLNKWGESHSYSLTKGINTGLPILYSHIGAYVERLKDSERFFAIRDNRNIETEFQKMLDFILEKQDFASRHAIDQFEMDIPALYRELFSIDYDAILNDKFNKNKSNYKKLFKTVEPYAIYFPSFHALKENNKTFYEGYHDMINLIQAKKENVYLETPLKNYLGYYNLLNDHGIIEKQILLAKANGFKGFGIYYYWFSHNSVTGNNMLMKGVIDKFFQKDLDDFDVFFIYANESWSENPAFNQHSNEYIIKNEYAEKDIIKNFENLLPYFKHKNYKKVDNKPVLFIHHPWEMTKEEFRHFCALGEDILKKNGFAGLELVVNSMQENCEECKNYSQHPNYKSPGNFTGIEEGIRFIDYKKYVDDYLLTVPFQTRNIQTVFYNFDNSVRYFNHKNKKVLITKTKNNNLEYFKKFLNFQLSTYDSPDKAGKIFLLNSWNEWGEQMGIEPSSESGFKLLDIFNEVILERVKKIETSEKKKIIYVGHDAGFYGAQLLSLSIVKELRERFKFDVHFILKSGGPLEEEYKKFATVYNLAECYQTDEKKHDLIRRLESNGADHAIVNTVVCGDILGMLHDEGVKTVSLVHELPGVIKQYGQEKNAKTIASKADQIVFPSTYVKEKFREVTFFSNEKTNIRPQGLIRENIYKQNIEEARTELRKKLNIDGDALVVLGVGSGIKRKGVDLFVDVAKKLVNHNIHFVWVGDLLPEMKKKIMLLSLKNVTFINTTPEISMYYAGADIYLMTSREDPFPCVVIESMSVGVPVVGFRDAGGFVDIITEKTGILVPYLDTTAMASALELLENNDAIRKELGEGSRKMMAERFVFKDYIYFLLNSLGINYKKVSAIVPNYNYANYLTDRFDSILFQTYPLYELIILDDASTDQSVSVIRDYRKNADFKDIKTILNKTNSGSVFRQWAKGIQESSGDFLWIAEADDLSSPYFLENVMKGFDNSQAVLSYSQSEVIDEKGEKSAPNYLEYTSDVDDNKWNIGYVRSGTQEIIDSLAIKNTIPNVSAVVFKKVDVSSILEKLTNFSVAGDWFFYVWLLQRGDIAYTQKALNIHRRHSNSVTTALNKKKHFEEIVYMQDYIAELMKLEKQNVDKAKKYRKKIREYLLSKDK